MSRCCNPIDKAYKNYGGRGIRVTESWKHFKNFALDMGLRPEEHLTLERKDNGLGYEKSNCIWASRSDQCVNRRLFQNNTTGRTGVIKRSRNQWVARFEYLGTRYRIGVYSSLEKASRARDSFVHKFTIDPASALAGVIPSHDTVWSSSHTGIRGVTPHKDGGYIARCTIKGERHYLGYFQTMKEAVDARSRFVESRTH